LGELDGTGFAPLQPDGWKPAGSGKKDSGERAICSENGVPLYAAPICLCLCFLPERGGTHFTAQVIDLRSGGILDEFASQRLADLPGVLMKLTRWVYPR
jgi:hypothetical protein